MQSLLAWRSNEVVMSELHRVYLNLGSNIQPEMNLPKAVQLLSEYGEVRHVSNAWESKSVGAPGPNYLNACVLFISPTRQAELKGQVIRPIEARLGRERSANKYTPRTIDIDIVLFNDKPANAVFWELAFVIVPLADIYPEYQNPATHENIAEIATRLRQEVWMEPHPEVFSQLNGNSFRA